MRDYEELLGTELDAMCYDENIVGWCEACGEAIRKDDECIAIQTPDGKKILLCADCKEEMMMTDILDLLGLKYFEDDGCGADEWTGYKN